MSPLCLSWLTSFVATNIPTGDIRINTQVIYHCSGAIMKIGNHQATQSWYLVAHSTHICDHQSSCMRPVWAMGETWTQWGWGIMAAILQTIFSMAFLLNENCYVLILISLKCVAKGLIDNNPALVQIMAWHQTGNKPFSVPMVAQFNDPYMCHSTSMS